MATAVAIMDGPSFADANTDVLVLVDPPRALVRWIPRDLWCPTLGDRVNRAYAAGGPDGLIAALAEHGLAAENVLCLLPAAIEAGIEGLRVAMPVRERVEYWYPADRMRPIEEGRRQVAFSPPVEVLEGQRFHEWIGARYRVEGPGSDLDRLQRQRELLAVLLGEGTDFSRFLGVEAAVRVFGPRALEELGQVRWDWRFELLGRLRPETIEGRKVLTRIPEG
jgi:hypothetical protein